MRIREKRRSLNIIKPSSDLLNYGLKLNEQKSREEFGEKTTNIVAPMRFKKIINQ